MISDPLNLIITGVGGQGNVLASQILGKALVKSGYLITVGETYGLSQRGGAVLSHIRISKKEKLGPLMPKGLAHIVAGLEPVETLRILPEYGNPNVIVITNSRPVHPLGVIAGELEYPDLDVLKKSIQDLSSKLYWIEATSIAMELGNPIMANIVMLGAIIGTKILPVSSDDILQEIKENFPQNKWEVNEKAFIHGFNLIL
ncbi:MAG: indolepyruvate oxidoreductase subunit beta [Desulfobacterales bacterium]|nr:indolepyruvate oxidoreductase subunit beta [Desulfobacterales bacterium]